LEKIYIKEYIKTYNNPKNKADLKAIMKMNVSNNNYEKQKRSYKVVMLGDCECGKTSLLTRYIKNLFEEQYTATVFDSSSTEIVMGKLDDLTIDIWDTSGSSEFDRVRPLTYEDVSLFLVCFDMSNPQSLNNITQKWLSEIKSHKNIVPVVMLGCKSDLMDGNKDKSKFMHVAKQLGAVAYYECSSKTPEQRQNIDRLFNVVALIVAGQQNKIPKDVKVKYKKESNHAKCVIQ